MADRDAELKSARRVRRSEAEERQARLAYLGTLAAGLAHEIRSPLEAMKMSAELILEDIGDRNDEDTRGIKERVERIHREAEGLKKTLDEFLAFARPPRMERFPTDINSYLEEILEFLEPELNRRGIDLVLDFAEDLYPVLIDQAQFGQVVLNLVQNAREAVGGHGEIRITTREAGEYIEILFQDNGGGVPENLEDRIFDVFFTTKERGTGLGLGIVRRVVEEHEGTIILENNPGVGATFIVRLPKGKFLEYQAAGTQTAKRRQSNTPGPGKAEEKLQ